MGYSKYCKTVKDVVLVDWKKLPHEEMPSVKKQVELMFP
jgi:hypothetical protein